MLVALLMVIDVSCYFINACGLTMCISVHLCGRQPPHTGTTGTKLQTTDDDNDDPERYLHRVLVRSPRIVQKQLGEVERGD